MLALVSQSMTNREIASTLGISPATVKRHVENILRKLRLRNRIEAAIYSLSMSECHEHKDGDCALPLGVAGTNFERTTFDSSRLTS